MFNLRNMKNSYTSAILYCRTASNNEEDKIKSFTEQEENLRMFCEEEGINIHGVIKETRNEERNIILPCKHR